MARPAAGLRQPAKWRSAAPAREARGGWLAGGPPQSSTPVQLRSERGQHSAAEEKPRVAVTTSTPPTNPIAITVLVRLEVSCELGPPSDCATTKLSLSRVAESDGMGEREREKNLSPWKFRALVLSSGCPLAWPAAAAGLPQDS